MPAIPALDDLSDADLAQQVQQRLDQLTKPQGALGRLEDLARQVALVQGCTHPRWQAPQLLVCAADHGLAAQGVSAYPAAVTAQMVRNMLAGGAAVAVLARLHGLALTVVDCGVAHDFSHALAHDLSPDLSPDLAPDLAHSASLKSSHNSSHSPSHDAVHDFKPDLEPQPRLHIAKVCHGTADSSLGPALTPAQCEAAVANGRELVRGLPGNVLLLGEMGIANTSAASLLMCRLTGLPLARCVGRGTGLDDAALAHKTAVLQRVLQRHAAVQGPLHLLAAFGGAEIATLVGAVLQAAAERRVVLVDGFITTAAVAVAHALAPHVLQRCVFAHGSAEAGHSAWLQVLGVRPLLDLDLRLGEGSGAALAWPLLVAALALLDGMASFAGAGVATRTPAAASPDGDGEQHERDEQNGQGSDVKGADGA